jgi:serine/threonine-protein kinase
VTRFARLAPEEQLGRYRLIARLGQGGMADVFLARRFGACGFEKLVAIKCLLPTRSEDHRVVAMFLNEARIAAQFDHPNICRVHELDEAGGRLFLVMEFLSGLPWSEVVPVIPDRPRTTLIRFVVGVIAQACAGLHHAHTAVGICGQPRSIVHRDVSPSNLFVTDEGVVKLLDFGVSKVLTESSVTATGVHAGKVPYMSPEQLRNIPVDARTDVFSLAIVTWEALAGRTLFDRASAYDTAMAVAAGDIAALPGDDAVTRRLDAVLRRALARDRTCRHGSAREFVDDLRRAIVAYGAPMTTVEIQRHVSMWLGPSLLRRGREFAALLGGRRQSEDMTGERTSLHAPAPVAGVRLREVSIAVGNGARDAAPAIDRAPAGSVAETVDPPGAATIALSRELTVPRAAVMVDAPDVSAMAPRGEPVPRRDAIPDDTASINHPGWAPTAAVPEPSPVSRRRPLILLVIAVLAMEAGVIAGHLLG